MKLFGRDLFKQKETAVEPAAAIEVTTHDQVQLLEQANNELQAQVQAWQYYSQLVTFARYDGEKNLGEMGPPKRYVVDYELLRTRSWQLYLESEICQTVIKRYALWVIGSGLRLQAIPQKDVLKSEGIVLPDTEEFNTLVEARWNVFSGSTMGDYAGMKSLNELALTAFTNAIVGGDCLVVLRVIDNNVKVQLFDASQVCTPMDLGWSGCDYIAANGNIVRDGVEIDATRQHVAYYVRTTAMTYERIPCRGVTGEVMAFLVMGMEYRIDNERGLPLICAVMESVKKMERYKEATLGSAEERQKIPYFFQHPIGATGENPLEARLKRASGISGNTDLPKDSVTGREFANHVAATTNKQVFNMPVGAELKSVDSKNELQFKDFYTTNIDLICATLNIPPNVAMQKFDSNYSASRANIKDWEYTLIVTRKGGPAKFYQSVYNLWQLLQVLTNKIQAPGLVKAVNEKNEMAINAYRKATWIGSAVPHIDPLKEVKAVREKLGPLGANLPLTNLEDATEAVQGGESASNLKQFTRELETARALGLQVDPNEAPPGDTGAGEIDNEN